MRRSKELIVLVVLLLGTVAFVLWYVVDRRAAQRAAPQPERKDIGPLTSEPVSAPPTTGRAEIAVPPSQPLSFDQVDGKTLDASSGRPVIKDSAEDRAAMEAALREMNEAVKDVTFEAPKKTEPKK